MEKKRGYQRHPRFTKRLEVTFSAGGLSFRGILSNISENGLFIRTNRGFAPNTIIDIELLMPNNKISRLKGIVRRAIKTPLSSVKNGMGVELLEKDETYIKYVNSVVREKGSDKKEIPDVQSSPEYQIVICTSCGIKNKILLSRLSEKPKCGKCGTPLTVTTM